MKSHEYADLFPKMSAVELEALTADIAANGLRQPIIRYNGEVLDGRNRLAACEKAKVKPIFVDHEGNDQSAFALVISLNVQRRDLTAGQRAIVAAKAMNGMPERRGGDRKSEQAKNQKGGTHHFDSADALAKAFKVGSQSVQQAKAILTEAADLADQLESGALTVSAAYQELQRRRSEANKNARDMERVAKYSDAIASGEMTIKEALEKVQQEQREEEQRKGSQAATRKRWLDKMVELTEWVEMFVKGKSDDELKWYSEAGPGNFDHKITRKRFRNVVSELERVGLLTFGG